MTNPIVDLIPETVKMAIVLVVTYGFFAIGIIKANREHRRK